MQDLAKRFAEKEIPVAAIEQMLTPGYELLKDDAFWASMDNGLAVFISEGYFKYIKMPVAPQSEVMCEKTFYVSPLIPIMASKAYFYLLVISKAKCKLFKADAFGMQYVPVEDLPEDMMEVKRISEKDASTVRVANSSGGGANFHGMGGGNPDEKANIATYFEHVDDILYKQIFNTENVPLLLAGVEYLIPIYRSVCDYHNVCSESLTGSHEHDETHALYEKAKEVMLPYFRQPLEKALTIYANQSATELTSSSPNEVIPGAYYGRVSHIFVQKAEHIWGTFDEANNVLKLQEGEDAQDLLDMALIKTIQTGGEVYVLDREEMPAEGAIAAVFRY
ncbi:baeRF7 domain-containing protein [Dyadobacter sp.]|uniref:baeRF7 domain-containing protein n=1 Tax=Dyadobacter sp. TaxID=1914288 RepID=UPI003F727EF7